MAANGIGGGAVAARIATIVVVLLGIGEVVSRIQGDLWRLGYPMAEQLNTLPYYLLWVLVAITYRVGWPGLAATPWRLRVAELALRDRLAIAAAAVLGLAMYGTSIAEVIANGCRRPIGLDMISAAIAAPVVEEWVFRGLVWNAVVAAVNRRRGAEPVALLVSAVAFGLFHMAFEGHSWEGLARVPGHIAFGLIIGVMRWRARSLAPGALVHGVGNLLARLAFT